MWTLILAEFSNFFGGVIAKPIAECCPKEVTDPLGRWSTTLLTTDTPTEDAEAVFLDLQQAAIVSVEKFSFLIAAILVLVTTLVLIVGTCYMTCFNDDKFNYTAVPQFDFMDEGIRDLESLIQTLKDMKHPLHQTVRHLAAEFEEFTMIKSKIPVSDL